MMKIQIGLYYNGEHGSLRAINASRGKCVGAIKPASTFTGYGYNLGEVLAKQNLGDLTLSIIERETSQRDLMVLQEKGLSCIITGMKNSYPYQIKMGANIK